MRQVVKNDAGEIIGVETIYEPSPGDIADDWYLSWEDEEVTDPPEGYESVAVVFDFG